MPSLPSPHTAWPAAQCSPRVWARSRSRPRGAGQPLIAREDAGRLVQPISGATPGSPLPPSSRSRSALPHRRCSCQACPPHRVPGCSSRAVSMRCLLAPRTFPDIRLRSWTRPPARPPCAAFWPECSAQGRQVCVRRARPAAPPLPCAQEPRISDLEGLAVALQAAQQLVNTQAPTRACPKARLCSPRAVRPPAAT